MSGRAWRIARTGMRSSAFALVLAGPRNVGQLPSPISEHVCSSAHAVWRGVSGLVGVGRSHASNQLRSHATKPANRRPCSDHSEVFCGPTQAPSWQYADLLEIRSLVLTTAVLVLSLAVLIG